MPDKKTLIKWSQGCLIAALLCVFIGLFGRLPVFYIIAVAFVILSFVVFGFARKKQEGE